MRPVEIRPGFHRQPMHDFSAALAAGVLLLAIVAGGFTILIQIAS